MAPPRPAACVSGEPTARFEDRAIDVRASRARTPRMTRAQLDPDRRRDGMRTPLLAEAGKSDTWGRRSPAASSPAAPWAEAAPRGSADLTLERAGPPGWYTLRRS